MAPLRWFIILSILAVTILGCEDNGPEPFPAPRYISSFGTWGTDAGEFEWPRAIAVGLDSLLYVGDTGNRRIAVFKTNGEFVSQWPLEFDLP